MNLITVLFIIGFIIVCFFFNRGSSKLKEDIVYISPSSKKYHTKECPFIAGREEVISKNVAIDKGYLPCKSCKPDSY